MNEEKIIERLKAAQMAVDRERRLDFLALCDPARFEAAKSEYVRAWDAAGVVWDAAEAAEEEGDLAEAKRLWDLIASFDGEASERANKILVKQQTKKD